MNIITKEEKAYIALRDIRDELDNLNQQRNYTLPYTMPETVRSYILSLNEILEKGLSVAGMQRNKKPIVIVPEPLHRIEITEVKPNIQRKTVSKKMESEL